jgi:hypothetical protein
MAMLQDFATDIRTQAIFWLVIIDLITGVIAALRTRTFDFSRLGEWYFTNVLPFLIGHFMIFSLTYLGVDRLPEIRDLLFETLVTVGAGPAILSLITSIKENVQEARGTGTT